MIQSENHDKFYLPNPDVNVEIQTVMEKYRINKVAICGAGIMGSGIACHLAGAGLQVLLLDRRSENDNRNSIVEKGFNNCLKSRPNPIYHSSFSERIRLGNYEDHIHEMADCDWIIEAIVEQVDEKIKLFNLIELHRSSHSIVSTNTSGIPIHSLELGRSENFKTQFLGVHFFNPPRYMSLLEIIPGSLTSMALLDFFKDFGKNRLGKEVVLCKDTPGFIANRIGVVYMCKMMQYTEELQLSFTDADKLLGNALGRPKSGIFRLADIVGLDTAYSVLSDLKKNCTHDLLLKGLMLSRAMNFLLDQKFLGTKTGKGFYSKTTQKDDKGRNIIQTLQLDSLDYAVDKRSNLESIQLTKQIEALPLRINALMKLEDRGSILIKRSFGFLLAYVSNSLLEISGSITSIDQAMKSGFGWEFGPFEYWDLIGLEPGIELIESIGETPAEWILEMRKNGYNTFYTIASGLKEVYDPINFDYRKVESYQQEINFAIKKKEDLVYANDEMNLHDLGDGVLCLEFTSKHNAIGEGIIRGLLHSIQLAESEHWTGLVIGNQAQHFSVGANLLMMGMMAFQAQYEELDHAVKLFQECSMRCKYSTIPVVCATQGYTFGGGVEFLMHCDAAVCSAESYLGLVEMSIGILPAGGGTKEFAVRLSQDIKTVEVNSHQLINRFKSIATAAVSTSAYEAFDLGYLDSSRDEVLIYGKNNIKRAKTKALELSVNYTPPISGQGIQVLGQQGMATLLIAANSMKLAGYASEHDVLIAKKIAHVLCGGDLSTPQKVSEAYLLDLEREAFLSLCAEPKTLERIQYMLENNRPLRN